MKIIYGITKSNFGGAQRYVFDLARASKEAGHDISVICGGEGLLVEKLKSNNIKVFPIPHMQRDISIVDELRSLHFIFRTLFEESPDVFHSNSSKMGGLGAVAARLAGVKNIVFTSHGLTYEEDRPLIVKWIIAFFTWLTFFFAHKVIAISQSNYRKISNMPFIKTKVTLIPNGIDHVNFLGTEEARRKIAEIAQKPIDPGALWIGTISELVRNKGVKYALLALSGMSNKKWVFVVISSGEEKESLENLAKSLKIDKQVFFIGFVPDASCYLRAFDIFTLTSLKEGHPYVLLEAADAELSVVASSISGIEDIIEENVTGLLAKPKDVLDIRNKISKLIEDKSLGKKLGKELQSSVKEKFSKQKMVEKTLEVYSH